MQKLTLKIFLQRYKYFVILGNYGKRVKIQRSQTYDSQKRNKYLMLEPNYHPSKELSVI